MLAKAFALILGIAICATYAYGAESIKFDCDCGTEENKRNATVEWTSICEDPEVGQIKCPGFPSPFLACSYMSCRFPTESVMTSLRKRRHAPPPCDVPALETANVKCSIWPFWLTCEISCIYGHAYETDKGTVNTTNVNCRQTEKTWKPNPLKNCEPFFNCKVQLKSPGSLHCKNFVNIPSGCEISCLEYENNTALAPKIYECKDENYAKILPHCAVLDETVKLVKRPK